MRKIKLLLLLVSITALSCKKKEIVVQEKEVEKTYKWQEYPAFRGRSSVQMNSQALADRLLIIGPGTFYIHRRTGFSSSTKPIPLTLRKMPINKDYHISMNQYGYLYLNQHKEYSVVNNEIKITDWDANFERFDFPLDTESEAFSINNQNQALLAYVIKGEHGKSVKLLLIDLDATHTAKELKVVNNQAIDIADNYTSAVSTINDQFYFTSNKATYRISPDGSLIKLNTPLMTRFIEQNGVIYGMTSDSFYTSTDNGVTWNVAGKNSDNLSSWNFTKVADKIVIHRFGQISTIEFTPNSYSLKVLENDILASKQITSVAMFDDEVYVTTMSGVYTRKLENFFEEKEQK